MTRVAAEPRLMWRFESAVINTSLSSEANALNSEFKLVIEFPAVRMLNANEAEMINSKMR